MFPCEDQNGVNGSPPASDSSEGRGSRQVKGASLVLTQFYALLVKRFHHAARSQKDFLAQVLGLMGRPINMEHLLLTSSHGTEGRWKLASDQSSSVCSGDQCVDVIPDRSSCHLCPRLSDLHLDCSSVWRVSQSDSEPVDVRTADDLLQVRGPL